MPKLAPVRVRRSWGDRTGGEHEEGRRDGRSPASRGTKSNSKDHYACESWPRSVCSGLMRGRQEKATYHTHATGFRPRSPCSIAILPVRCKEKQLRPG
jgi:hypothetical protein